MSDDRLPDEPPQPKAAFASFVKLYLDEKYEPTARHGFSCQTWLAKNVNRLLHENRFYCWYAKSFNAYKNGDDSNPLWLYMTIDRAIKQGGSKNAKIVDIRTNLMRAVEKELGKQGRIAEIAETQRVIVDAPLSWFRPEVWKMELDRIGNRAIGNQQYDDEFLIKDLNVDEFEVIIE